jgi:hypothetical protein
MAEALRAETRRTMQMGWSDQRTIYWSGWRDQLPRMHPVTFNFMKDTGLVSWAARRAALLYRTGTLYTGKAAKRMGYAATDRCMAGCGEPDGIHHAVSGCSKMEAHRTKRHNTAALMLARALQHNGIGARLHSADVGSNKDCEEAGLECGAQRNIGPMLLPTTLPARERERMARQCPDMVWVQEAAGVTDPHRVVHLVEVKYCRDAWPQQQEERALAQYAELTEQLGNVPGQQARCHTIVIGVAGTIYKATEAILIEDFAVPKQVAKRTLLDIHKHSITSLHGIIKFRRRLERKCGNTTGKKRNTRIAQHVRFLTGKKRRRNPAGVT